MLNPKHLGLAGGVIWGFSLFILTLISLSNGYGAELLNLIASLYPGFKVSSSGAVIGLVYGFFDASIGLYLFALLYNWLESCTAQTKKK